MTAPATPAARPPPRRRRRCLAAAALLAATTTAQGDTQPNRHVQVSWDFERGLQGWANATSTEMDAEVYSRGGELHASVRGSTPHIDSPRLQLRVDDKQHMLIRMMCTGPARVGRAVLRTGTAGGTPLQTMDHGLSHWGARPKATAVRWSSASTGAAQLVDDDPYTSWTAPTAGDAYVTLDLGGYFPVTELDILVPFGADSAGEPSGASPRNVRLQKASAADGTWDNVYVWSLAGTNATTGWQSFSGFSG